jgi:endonuclease III
MPAMKREASPALVGRSSAYHTSVTLYDLEQDGPRRSKRVKVKQETAAALTGGEISPTEPVASGSRPRTTSVKVKDTEGTATKSEPLSRAEKLSSPKKVKPVPQSLAVPHPAPPRWREAYDTIKRMREHIVAPVDTMGCEQAQYKEIDPKVRRHITRPSIPGTMTMQRRIAGSPLWCR